MRSGATDACSICNWSVLRSALDQHERDAACFFLVTENGTSNHDQHRKHGILDDGD